MPVENENLLLQLLQGQKEYIHELKFQTEITRRLEQDLCEIKESIKDHNKRLVDISTETTVNTEAVKYLKEEVINNKSIHEDMKTRIKESKNDAITTAQKNVMLKLYGAICTSGIALLFAIIGLATKAK